MKQFLTIAACSTLLAFAVPAAAHTGSDDAFVSLKTATVAGVIPAVQVKLAKHGADDPSGDDRGGGKGGGSGKGGKGGKGRGGHDDGAGHS